MATTSDILVIGGGMAGTSAAARLAAEASVVLLEAEQALGTQSSGRSAAMFIPSYGAPALHPLISAAHVFMQAPDALDEPSMLSPRSVMTIAAEDEMDVLAEDMATREGLRRITPEEAVERLPILRRAPIADAAIEEAAADIDVARLLQGFARLLRRLGGQTITGARVGAIRREGGSWTVETPAGRFSAPVLVNAAGAWADRVAGLAGIAPAGLVPHRRTAAILPAPEGHDVRGWPMVATAAERWYAKPDAGRLLVSAAEEDPTEPHDAYPLDLVLAEGLHRFEQAMTVPVTRVEHAWAGLRTFAPDRMPVVGFAPDAEGFFWLAGQGGVGIQLSPALSTVAADLIARRPSAFPAATLQAMAPERFAVAA